MKRCAWVDGSTIYREYHDFEWGCPVHEDGKLFEMLILEGAQAGLSWITVLKRRDGYRAAFDGFDPAVVARYDEAKLQALMTDERIIRNRLKIESAVINARCFLEVAKEFGSFDRYLWGFVDGTPIVGHFETTADVPATTPLSDQISRDLKKRGFKFVGSTIIYAYMQAVGVVNDHAKDCFVYQEMINK